MKLCLLIFGSFFSSSAFAVASPAEVISEYAKICFSEVGTQVSIKLSRAYHDAKVGSKAEREAKIALETFNEHISSFPMFEIGCNENLDGDEKYLCYSQNYADETKRISKRYDAAIALTATPECAYLFAAQ